MFKFKYKDDMKKENMILDTKILSNNESIQFLRKDIEKLMKLLYKCKFKANFSKKSIKYIY